MKRPVFAPAARADLTSIARYIAADDPERADSFVAELIALADCIAERPSSFPACDDLSPGLRSARHGRYRLYFRDLGATVRIVRVLHGARDLPTIFDPR